MSARLKAGLVVRALIRRAEVQGANATILAKGDEDAGAIVLILANRSGQAKILTQAVKGEGERIWLDVKGLRPEIEVADDIAKLRARDPDLWVVEVEDKELRAFIDDPIETAVGKP